MIAVKSAWRRIWTRWVSFQDCSTVSFPSGTLTSSGRTFSFCSLLSVNANDNVRYFYSVIRMLMQMLFVPMTSQRVHWTCCWRLPAGCRGIRVDELLCLSHQRNHGTTLVIVCIHFSSMKKKTLFVYVIVMFRLTSPKVKIDLSLYRSNEYEYWHFYTYTLYIVHVRTSLPGFDAGMLPARHTMSRLVSASDVITDVCSR